ncbi:hypothetical protein QTU96_004785 [Enterobacter asburiae]|uniref:hypothetical protein n=1 Tax=Enterobacteriaceae TaxID=543 RepID=UPI0014783659|nr:MULTISPECIES: hypothetical protein [Enterobacter cloacae complex]ELP5722362.1 hypothetical protein [Enterobacter asburiae]HED2515796.1 hypothetical protein [Enterobacter asburiae]
MKKNKSKDRKENVITARLSNSQVEVLKKLIDEGKVSKGTLSSAIGYLVDQYMVLNSK